YFHSGYVNLVITGLVGLRPRADDSVEVNPLAPRDWDWFALDDVRYHGRRLAILWDRDGSRFGRGAGLLILADDRVIAQAPTLGRLAAYLGPPRIAPLPARLVNVAVNNGRGRYPSVAGSFATAESPAAKLVDGNYWYTRAPANRWTTVGTVHEQDTVTVDFGTARTIQRIVLYLLDDEVPGGVRTPARYEVQLREGNRWVTIPGQRRDPERPQGHRANTVSFPAARTSGIRVVLVPRPESALGLTEIEAWGPLPVR
ncbi:MAG: discoidin domain-containing protein, partial [Gemmatimonadota bacterium]